MQGNTLPRGLRLMDVSDPEREIAYRRIHGLEAGMPGSGQGADDPPRCCQWLFRCLRCFSGEPEESQDTTPRYESYNCRVEECSSLLNVLVSGPRSRALENHLYQYEAPQVPANVAPAVQPQRQSPAFVDDVDAGPLLPKVRYPNVAKPYPARNAPD